MKHIQLSEYLAAFAENKDIARTIRLEQIIPALERGEEVVLDFTNINSVTQSFIHALISDLLRNYGDEVLDKLSFKSCNEVIQKIISIVIDYMQGAH